jgi:peptide/nickel transport system permease protein
VSVSVVEPVTSAGISVNRGRPRMLRLAGFRQLQLSHRVALITLVLVTLLALLGPTLAPHNPTLPVGMPFTPPSSAFPFGTDLVGRDELSQVLYGIQSTWFSALAVIAIGALVGGTVGLVAGASPGWFDNLLMRITDIFLSLPAPLLAIPVVAALGPSLFHTLIAVAILWWPYYARLVRAEVRAVASMPHVDAARLAKIGRFRRLTHYLLPCAIPVTIVAASLDIGNLIIVLSGLSFLGLGAQPPSPELGSLTANGLPYLLTNWWIPIIPGIAVFGLSLTGNLTGDAIRDMVDHR